MKRPAAGQDPVDFVVARLASAAKYRGVHPDTIADVVAGERRSTGDVAELEKLARARLHKVAALHLLTAKPAALRRAVAGLDSADVRGWCREMLAGHVSTAERLPDLDRFYPTILELVPVPRIVADIACALNVFTVPWLREVCDAQYVGYDLNAEFVSAGEAFLGTLYPDCSMRYEDVLARSSPVTADLALLLKTYHCIEDRQRGAALRLVDEVAAAHVVVSFPTRAMNGRASVFSRRHVEELTDLADRRGWQVRTATLPTEELLAIAK